MELHRLAILLLRNVNGQKARWAPTVNLDMMVKKEKSLLSMELNPQISSHPAPTHYTKLPSLL
jgi:hypothetical protein